MIKALKLLWSFIKTNWLSILAVIGVVFLLIYGYQMLHSLLSNDTSMMEKLQQQEERHIQEIANLNKISNEQVQKQIELNRQFDQRITELRTEFQTQLDEIKKAQKRRQTHLIENPTEIGNEIENVFHIPNHQGSN